MYLTFNIIVAIHYTYNWIWWFTFGLVYVV